MRRAWRAGCAAAALWPVWAFPAHAADPPARAADPPAGAAAAPRPAAPADAGTGACVEAGCHASLVEGKVVHVPAEGGAMCDSCHVPTGKGHGFKDANPTVDATCVGCHDDPRGRGAVVHGPARTECTKCHDPHSAAHPKLLRRTGSDLCLSCHDNLPAELARNVTHAVAYDPGCETCHDPHAAPARRLLRAEGNAICLPCHGIAEAPAAGAEGEITLFGSRKVPVERIAGAPRVPVKDGRGHPVARHPVEGVGDPRQPGVPLRCYGCHEPHGSHRAHLLRGPEGGATICRQCHRR